MFFVYVSGLLVRISVFRNFPQTLVLLVAQSILGPGAHLIRRAEMLTWGRASELLRQHEIYSTVHSILQG